MKRSGLLALLVSAALAPVLTIVVTAAHAQDAPKPDTKPDGAPAPQASPTPAAPAPAPKDSPAPAPAPQATPAGADNGPATKPADKAPSENKPAADAKAPDPSKPALGDPLPAGTVPRKALFPLDDGRTWRYDLRTWLTPTASEDGAGEEIEPPRSHKLDVRVVETTKIDGRDARCLEYRLDDETAQRAYFFEDANNAVLCPRRVLGSGEHVHPFDFGPAQPTLQGDLAVGSTWEWRGKVGPANGKQTFKVLGEARIKAPSTLGVATLDAIVIQTIVENDDESKGVSTKWYSPEYGIVRELTEVRADKETFRTEAVLTKITGKK